MIAPRFLALTLFAVLLAATAPALAQDGAMPALPEICTVNAEHTMAAAAHQMTPTDQAHADLALGMDEMNTEMMKGMTASDIDVAFVCGMIPHHQGAINMAKAELAHGDDPWAKEMAEKVIAAQEQEIAEMLAWLEQQS